MANRSTLTRAEQIHQYLAERANTWVDGTEIMNERVGGQRGGARIFDLRHPTQPGVEPLDIRERRHPDPDRDIHQYMLVTTTQTALEEDPGNCGACGKRLPHDPGDQSYCDEVRGVDDEPVTPLRGNRTPDAAPAPGSVEEVLASVGPDVMVRADAETEAAAIRALPRWVDCPSCGRQTNNTRPTLDPRMVEAFCSRCGKWKAVRA